MPSCSQTDGQGVANFCYEFLSIFGETFSGRQAIKQRILGAEVGPVTRHLISTIDIESKAMESSWGKLCNGLYRAKV